jgi:tetratricopeptide (TPR) repeat protein
LAALLEDSKQYEAIVPLYEQAVAQVEASLGAQHSNLALNLKTLASFYASQGRVAEAVKTNEKALHIQETVLPAQDPATIDTLQQLAALYEKQGRKDAAAQALARAQGRETTKE